MRDEINIEWKDLKMVLRWCGVPEHELPLLDTNRPSRNDLIANISTRFAELGRCVFIENLSTGTWQITEVKEDWTTDVDGIQFCPYFIILSIDSLTPCKAWVAAALNEVNHEQE